jgi:hypothetical protein
VWAQAPPPFDAERELKDWRPSATDDLGTQMLEWWAVLADIKQDPGRFGRLRAAAANQPKTGCSRRHDDPKTHDLRSAVSRCPWQA